MATTPPRPKPTEAVTPFKLKKVAGRLVRVQESKPTGYVSASAKGAVALFRRG